MKRVISAVLSIVLAMSSFFMVTASAEETQQEGALSVNAVSNLFPEQSVTFDSSAKEVIVTYYLQTTKDILNMEWSVFYDPEILSYCSKNKSSTLMPNFDSMRMSYLEEPGKLYGVASSLSLYDFTSEKKILVQVVFDVLDGAFDKISDTTVSFTVSELSLSEVPEGEDYMDDTLEVDIVRNGKVQANAFTELIADIDTKVTESDFEHPVEEILIGDADENGIISISDVTEIQRYIAEIIILSDNAVLASDCNGDGTVNINDATCLQRFIAEYKDCGLTGQYIQIQK